jgi:hypothetical protein
MSLLRPTRNSAADAAAEKSEADDVRVNQRLRGRAPRMGRKDRALGETIVPKGPLQEEGTWRDQRT